MAIERRQLGDSLFEAGLLPKCEDIDPTSENLLPLLYSAWKRSIDEVSVNERHDATRPWPMWLRSAHHSNQQLTLLSTHFPVAKDWLGERLLWSSAKLPAGQLIGIASSRLGRRLDQRADWFTVFRAACSKINRQHDTLLTASDTTPARFVERAADLFGVRVLNLVPPRESDSLSDWCRRIQHTFDSAPNDVCDVHLSPPLTAHQFENPKLSTLTSLPLQDRAIAAMADQLLVFHLRKRGNLDAILRARLSDISRHSTSVLVALGKDLVDQDTADELLDLGAIGWVVLDTLNSKSAEHILDDLPSHKPTASIIDIPRCKEGEWLTHCTREQVIGWPDEDRDDYYDELLTSVVPEDRSALSALLRIVTMQKLIATSRMTRGETDVVSFTATPPADIAGLRTYQSHVGRWDFEPYGICIRADWLTQRPCRPVQYGDESLWRTMSELDRPFFQKDRTTNETNEVKVDWTREREWRHLGDVDLSDLPNDSGMVFVPTRTEAELLAKVSRWSVVVLDRSNQSPGANTKKG